MKYSFYTIIIMFLLIACQSNNPTTGDQKIVTNKETISNDSSTPSSHEEEKEIKEEFEEEEFDNQMPPRRFEWTGTINGSIKIHGQYQMANGFMDSGMDIWVGELIYDKVGKPIKLIGQLENEGKSIRLLEIDSKGNITGILSGKWQNGSITEGIWFSPKTKDNFNLTINATAKNEEGYTEIRPKKMADIVGKYHYEYGAEGYVGSLHVQTVKDDQVSFELFCLTSAPGRNIASLEEATEPMLDYAIKVSMSESCQFNIRFFDGFAVIDYLLDKNDCEFGHNAQVSGIFRKIE